MFYFVFFGFVLFLGENSLKYPQLRSHVNEFNGQSLFCERWQMAMAMAMAAASAAAKRRRLHKFFVRFLFRQKIFRIFPEFSGNLPLHYFT